MRAPVPRPAPPLPAPAAPAIRDDVPLAVIPSAEWDALVGGHPFLRHAFLEALHDTGCASRSTGGRRFP